VKLKRRLKKNKCQTPACLAPESLQRLLSFSFLFLCSFLHSQVLSEIHIRKSADHFYFFQKGEKKDTISKNAHDIFYLLCGDSLKKNLVFQIENARLLGLPNDSMVQLQYLPGHSYEAWFVKTKSEQDVAGNHSTTKLILHSFLNGSSAFPRTSIRIRILNKKDENWILENNFYYLD
jgi:hypothetical protein